MTVYDMHTHSTASDGVLTPSELVTRAKHRGVHVLALTDHDSVAGLTEAEQESQRLGLHLISGIEISVTWNRYTIHVLGLDIDKESQPLSVGISALQTVRAQRAREIGKRLERLGIDGALAGAQRLSPGNNVTRTHFCRFLIQTGKARDEKAAFKRYLGPGKPGYVKVNWAGLEQAVQWIRDAHGQAVIAHPSRYDMTQTTIRRLLSDFVDCGGAGLEVVHGNCGPAARTQNAELARRFGLSASAGSDFHDPDNQWTDLGQLATLPPDLVPIWGRFKAHTATPSALGRR